MANTKKVDQGSDAKFRQLALKGAIASGELSPEMFGLTLTGRFAPGWFAEAGLGQFFTIEMAKETCTLAAVKKRVAGATDLATVINIASRVKGVISDIETMEKDWVRYEGEVGTKGSGRVSGQEREVVRPSRSASRGKPPVGRKGSVVQEGPR